MFISGQNTIVQQEVLQTGKKTTVHERIVPEITNKQVSCREKWGRLVRGKKRKSQCCLSVQSSKRLGYDNLSKMEGSYTTHPQLQLLNTPVD